ncbi:Meiotically up-regulated gene 158 protein, partial [Durusdinium trenchii]
QCRQSWCPMFESMHGPGLSKKHVLWSERTEKENKSVSMHRVYVSTLFVVTLLAHFSRKPGKSTAVAGDEAKAGLQEFIAWLAPSLQCAINFDLGEHHPTYQLEVDDGQASLADLCKSNGYKAKMPGGSSTIPMKARGWLPLSAVLAFLMQRPQLKWLAAQLLDGVARKADTSIPFLKLPQECLEVSFESRRLRDPMLRARALQLCRARFGKGKTGAKNRVDKGASAATKARRRADAAAAKAIVTCRDKAQERSQYLVAA